MTKVMIDPGVCGFITSVEATANEEEDQQDVLVTVKSGCENVKNMMKNLGNTFDAYEVCLVKPGTGPFYEYARKNFPIHAACPIISGITKCIETEAKLALPRDVTITFKKE